MHEHHFNILIIIIAFFAVVFITFGICLLFL